MESQPTTTVTEKAKKPFLINYAKYLKFVPVTLIIIFACYLIIYQFMHVDMTPARVFVNRWPVILIILVLIISHPYLEKLSHKN